MTDAATQTPPHRAKPLARLATHRGLDLAQFRLLSIEAFQPCMAAVRAFAHYGKGSTLDATPVVSKQGQRISPYLVLNRQINAACQMSRAAEGNATLDQQLARACILRQVQKIYEAGMNNHLERDDIKRLRDAAIADEAARFGLGNKKTVKAQAKRNAT